jgi:hypothetical protein
MTKIVGNTDCHDEVRSLFCSVGFEHL